MNLPLVKAVRIINFCLGAFGVKIISSRSENFSMLSALKRIHDHNMKVDNIIDIGASNGTWSIKAMKLFPSATFIAVEPLKEREEALYGLTKKYPNLSYNLCAAGDTDGGTVMLSIAKDLDGSTVNGSCDKQRQVPVKTIDKIAAERDLSGTFLLKLDTHGYELPILNGASQTLQRTSIIIMEAYNFKISKNAMRFHEICAHMECLGFRCYDIADPMLRKFDKSLWQMDLFFCKKDEKIFEYPHYR